MRGDEHSGARPRERRLRRWPELSTTERWLFVPQVLVQVAVRLAAFVLALQIVAVTDVGGGLLDGEPTGRTGVAAIRACTAEGTLGVDWYRSCAATVRWTDGEVAEHTFDTTELDAGDVGSQVRVLERETSTKWGSGPPAPALDLPGRHEGFAWVLSAT